MLMWFSYVNLTGSFCCDFEFCLAPPLKSLNENEPHTVKMENKTKK